MGAKARDLARGAPLQLVLSSADTVMNNATISPMLSPLAGSLPSSPLAIRKKEGAKHRS